MAGPHVVSLFYELTEVESAVEAARLLLMDLQATPMSTPGRRWMNVVVSSGAALSLVTSRLRLVRLVLEGVVDPGLLLANHNAIAPLPKDPEVRDVRLAPWPTPRREAVRGGIRRPTVVPKADLRTRQHEGSGPPDDDEEPPDPAPDRQR